MAIRRNIAANYVGQGYRLVIGLVMTPIYLALMGPESYGLVSIYLVFSAIIGLFNFGLSATMSREIARMRGGTISTAAVRHRLVRLAVMMSGIALVFVVLVGIAAPAIATRWLKVATLPLGETVACLRLLAVAAGLSFVTYLYSSGLIGLERQVRLNALNMGIVTLRFVGVLGVLLLISTRPIAFSLFQVVASAVEITVTVAIFYHHLPAAEPDSAPAAEPSGSFHRFAGGLAFTDMVWAALTQVDRIVLSTALPLAEFAFFSLALTAAFGVMLLSSPVIQALQPRFAVLAASGQPNELRALYFKVSHGVAALSFSAGAVLAAFPRELVYAWTGNAAAANWAAPVLPLYALGNACVGISALPFLLQFALGKIRLHVIGHTVLAAVCVPAMVVLGLAWGGFGTGLVWLVTNFSYIALWVPVIHARLLPGQHGHWFLRHILPAAASAAVVVLIERLIPLPASRFGSGLALVAFGGMALGASLLTSAAYRQEIGGHLAALFHRSAQP